MKSDCPFCQLGLEMIRWQNAYGIAFADIFPVSPGHTLVIPRKHVNSLADLPLDEYLGLWSLVAEARSALEGQTGAEGFTIGVNDGLAAGQTVPHAHIHIIPRFMGDVPDPRGGIRWVIPDRAAYWEEET
jgi:diadenosine tetraphosphate (Ap4A) HIT family hydrolase